MKLAIMQPYFFPYVGYWQLISAVDAFVVYDDIQFTKKGWVNRNRILLNSDVTNISLPLLKDSSFVDIKDRRLANTWPKDRIKMLNRLKSGYQKAPYFDSVYPLIEVIILHEDINLFEFILNSLRQILKYLEINTELVVSSNLNRDKGLRSQDMVINICKIMKANEYVNPIGGVDFYDQSAFHDENIKLYFLKTDNIKYKQFNSEFVPGLSIIDIMMNNSVECVRSMLSDQYELI